MKKQVLLLLFLLLAQLAGICQENKISISGSFTDEPFLAFAKAIESTYDLKFFFDDADVKNLKVNGQFNQTPLANCLNQIIEGTGLLFAIKNSQVFIYSGKKLQPLFLEQETELGKPAEKTEEQLSRERLLAKQYELINIGLPGSQNTGYATVSGRISVYNDTLSVPGCNVYTEDESYGTSSDSEGDYSLRLPLGQHTLIFSSVGMESTQRQIHLYANGRLDVEMESKVNLIGDVQIMGDQKGNLNRVDVGMERIDVRSVKNLPKLLGEPDIMKSTLILPGVATVGEGASGFNVRGGKTDQNLILIDQTPIYYPSHFFGNFSAINSDVVKDANLYKGSFPVKYGGRISSVFQINTKDAAAEKIQGAGGISPVSAKFMVEGPIKKDRSSFLLSFRSTYSDWILKQVAVDELYKSAVNFYDLQGKFSFSLNKNNKLIFNLYGSEDGFQLRSDTTYNYYNNLVSSSLNTRFENNWKMQNVLSLSAFGYNIANKKDSLRAFELIHSLQNYSYKNLTEKTISENVKVIMGGEMQLYFVEPGERKIPPNSELTPVFTQTERGLEYGLFAGTEFSPVNGLKLETGIRLAGYLSLADGQKNSYREGLPLTEENLIETVETEINSIEKQYIYPEFRLSSNYRLSSYTALKFSYNTTTQFLHMLTNTTAISPTDTWKLSDEYLTPQRGHLLSAGIVKSNYQRTLEMSVEGFYKRMNNVKEYKPGADLLLNDHIETEILNGTGKSYGAEFSLQKNGERLYGRLGYTYSRTLIKTESEFEEELINDGEYFPANYDKPHNLNILANLEPARGIVLSVLMNYSTGRPITYPVTKYQLGDQVILHYSDYNQFRIPDYFRIDASLTIDRNLKKNKLIDGSWSFSVYNITARKNAYSVYYRSQGDHFEGFRLSIFGTAIPTVTYNFKF
jgi:hypothetical protein